MPRKPSNVELSFGHQRVPVPTANVNNTTLYYETRGNGPPLLFINGTCDDANTWADQVERLSSRFCCVTYDRRGNGRSDLGNVTQRTVELHADDAAELTTTLGFVQCALVGHSGGGRIAVDVLRRYPQLVKGAVLSEPGLSLDPERSAEFFAQHKPVVEQVVAARGPRAGVDAFFEVVLAGTWRALPEAYREQMRANHGELFSEDGRMQLVPYRVSMEELALIRCPCLLISGSDSLPLLRGIARIAANAIPGSQFVELAGAKHETYFDQPAEFAAAVASFAERLKATGV